MPLTSRVAILTASLAVLPLLSSIAQAQNGPAPTDTAPTQPSPAATDSSAPAGSAAPAAPPGQTNGYGWSVKPHRHGAGRPPTPRTRKGVPIPDAILPGFETLGDGSTRLFVQLTRPVAYETRATRGTLTYILKGAYTDKWNNTNPLVTVHFNTPVTSARLLPHGADLWFVVDLRSDVKPNVTMEPTKEGGAMLRIDFPQGEYLSRPVPPPPNAKTPAPPAGSAEPDSP